MKTLKQKFLNKKNTKIQKYKNTKIQKYKNTKIQKYKNTKNKIQFGGEIKEKLLQFIKKVFVFKKDRGASNELIFNYYVKKMGYDSIEDFKLVVLEAYNKGKEGYNQLKLISDTYNTPDIQSIHKFGIIRLHGMINNNFFLLDNINIVFLSPIKYMLCASQTSLDNFKSYLKKNLKNFLKNPNCYDKELSNKFLSASTIYYSGQYCIDLFLSRKEGENTELSIMDESNNFIPFKINDELGDLSTGQFTILLSKFLEIFKNDKYKNQKFTFFIKACREISKIDYQEENQNYLTFYEKIISSVNTISQISNPFSNNNGNINLLKEYKKCNPLKILSSDHNINFVQRPRNNFSSNNISSYPNFEISNDTQISLNIEQFSLLSQTIKDIIKDLPQSNNIDENININVKNIKLIYEYIIKEKKYFLYYYIAVICFPALRMVLGDFLQKSIVNNINLMMYIFDNNINIVFKYYLLNTFLFIGDHKSITMINFLINKYFSQLENELILSHNHIFKIEQLNFLNIDLDSANKLKYKITKLDLSFNNTKNNYIELFFLDPKNSLSFIQDLKEINLNTTGLTQFPEKLLELKNLEVINLQNNNIDQSSINDKITSIFNNNGNDIWTKIEVNNQSSLLSKSPSILPNQTFNQSNKFNQSNQSILQNQTFN